MTNKSKSSWQDLPLRIISALVIVPLALLCIIYGDWLYITMLFVVSLAMTYEWATLFKVDFSSFTVWIFFVWPIVAEYAAIQHMWWQAIWIGCCVAFIFGRHLWLGSAIISAAGISLLWLRFMTFSGMWMVLFIVLVVIASDSFAYITGKTFGGAKLMPSVSPGKTWSGAMGGLIGAGCVGGVIVGYLYGLQWTIIIGGVLFSICVGVVAQAGDLLESKFKRELGVKDSGTLIPGHGGVFDRFDALLAVSIFVALVSWALPNEEKLNKWGGELLMTKSISPSDAPSFMAPVTTPFLFK